MPRNKDDQYLTVDIPDSSGGLNTRMQQEEIELTQLTAALNIDLSTRGKKKKRLGNVSVLNDLGTNPIVILKHLQAPSVATRMCMVWNKRLYKHTEPLTTSGNWTDIDSTDRFTADQFTTAAVVAGGVLWITNGTDEVCSYNGTGITDYGTNTDDPPLGKVIAYFQNRLWIANTTTNPDYVYYSNALSHGDDQWNQSTQVFKVATGDTQEVTNMVPFAQNTLIIFKQRSVHELLISGSTATYWNLREVDGKHGCPTVDCAKYYNGTILYLSDDGVRTIPLAEGAKPVSYLNKTLFDSINWTYINRARMEIFDDKMFLSLPVDSDTYPTVVAVLDLITGGWVTYTGWNVGCWGIHIENGKEYLMYGDANDGEVHQCLKAATYDDEGSTAINYQEETKSIDFGFPFQYKVGGEVEVVISSSTGNTVTVSASIDGGSYTELGTTTATDTFHLDSLGKFKNIKFKIQHNATSTEQLVIDGLRATTFIEEYRSE